MNTGHGLSSIGQVPVIDLEAEEKVLIDQIYGACSRFGFFQVVNHGINADLIDRYREQCREFFEGLDLKHKKASKRSADNARGFFDDELTKQRRDWKEALDGGMPFSRDWALPDRDPLNAGLDGYNQFPSTAILPHFRDTFVEYFQACEKLSDRLAVLMARALGAHGDEALVRDLRAHHTSYLRTNFYPMCPNENNNSIDSPLGISPHNDAGFLTVLLQDNDCHSLQVYLRETDEWSTVHPLPNALTINTGDMAQVWSNGRYQAPSHRVLTNPNQVRYSAPFFYNPGYETWVQPLQATDSGIEEPDFYHPILWGYFRAARFAGDFTDLGIEIQISDYETSRVDSSPHRQLQKVFVREGWCRRPFSADAYRELLKITQCP